MVKKDVSQKRAQLTRIDNALTSKDAVKAKIDKLAKLKKDKFKIVEVIEQIEKWAPTGMWVTNVEPITGDISQKAQANQATINPEEIEGGSSISRRRGKIMRARENVMNTGKVVKGSGNQITGFTIKGYYVNSTQNTTIDDMLFNYLSSLTLKQDRKIFQEDSKLTRIVDFVASETVKNLSSFEIQLALYEPIGKK